MTWGGGVRNVEVLPNCSKVRDSEFVGNEGDEAAATFNGTNLRQKKRCWDGEWKVESKSIWRQRTQRDLNGPIHSKTPS